MPRRPKYRERRLWRRIDTLQTFGIHIRTDTTFALSPDVKCRNTVDGRKVYSRIGSSKFKDRFVDTMYGKKGDRLYKHKMSFQTLVGLSPLIMSTLITLMI